MCVCVCMCASPLTLADVNQLSNVDGDNVYICFQPVLSFQLVNCCQHDKQIKEANTEIFETIMKNSNLTLSEGAQEQTKVTSGRDGRRE